MRRDICGPIVVFFPFSKSIQTMANPQIAGIIQNTRLQFAAMKTDQLHTTLTVTKDHHLINEDFCVVFQQKMWTCDTPALMDLVPAPTSLCAVISTNDLNAFYNHKPYDAHDVRYVTDEDLKIAQACGFSTYGERVYRRNPIPAPEEIFAQMKSDPSLFEHLVVEDHGAHLLRDLNGDFVPTATFFSYIDNNLNETDYDLKKVVRLLRLRRDVIIVDESKPTRFANCFEALAQGENIAAEPGKEIYPIPYYNAEDGRQESVQFLWQPSKDDFQRVMDSRGKRSVKSAALELDFFGLSSCEYKTGATLKF